MTKKAKMGTLPGTWPFVCPVYMVKGELPGVRGVAALHSGRFARMYVRVEEKYEGSNELNEILHHEHKHALDKSSLWCLFTSSRELEKRAYAYDNVRRGKPVPWMEPRDIKSRQVARVVMALVVVATSVALVTL